jgi:hypothetical protein
MQELFHEYANGIQIYCSAPPKHIPLPQLHEYKITYDGMEIKFKTCHPYEELFDRETAVFIIRSLRAAQLEKEGV